MIVRVTLQDVNPRLAARAVRAAISTETTTLIIIFLFVLIVAIVKNSVQR